MLGERLLKLRKEAKLTQEALSQKLKIARTTYSGYELGTSEPDNDTLNKIADFYGVTTDNLLGRDISQYEQNKTNFIMDELVKKYDIDLSIEGEKENLEKFIKLYVEFRKS